MAEHFQRWLLGGRPIIDGKPVEWHWVHRLRGAYDFASKFESWPADVTENVDLALALAEPVGVSELSDDRAQQVLAALAAAETAYSRWIGRPM